MYLEHFGLSAPPFKITPVTDFFFPGANRAEILEALIYAITESEGIIKVTGEVGSGKTMLCRMLLERLPPHIETVYLANPSLSREEMLYAIADGLGLNLEGQRVNVIMQSLQNLLAKKSAEGKRVVVLVDEAHAMPLDTLEELRLLYNLQLGDHKLLHIVLFGQPELNDKLSQSNMRQLKDRIVHHFTILPLSKSVIIAYLIYRMRAAGYHGPNVFSSAAVKLIGAASDGLMRRVNILADKALLAAFVENTHYIEIRHVQAAIRDSELAPQKFWSQRKILAGAGIALAAVALAGTGWFVGKDNAGNPTAPSNLPKAVPVASVAAPVAAVGAASESVAADTLASVQSPPAAVAIDKVTAPAETTNAPTSLLAQRLAATTELLAKRNKTSASIQLFFTTEIQPERLEGFLERANKLGKLSEIYILPSPIKGKNGYRIVYGNYPDFQAARAAIRQLPQRYRSGFAPSPYQIPADEVMPQ